ncbi:Penicillin-binding protein 2D [Sodalis glossinidius str. 'morsitans']|uniref:Penicillin-binding protein 2D n=1 Tax=Sodalis glossinidius (strain morsitans) TaxID=343509 RepID=A0A193QFB0_SODGM|nr:Penicillin-binding protein 2D [Sodalis glossinidius str. 'morsitans']
MISSWRACWNLSHEALQQPSVPAAAPLALAIAGLLGLDGSVAVGDSAICFRTGAVHRRQAERQTTGLAAFHYVAHSRWVPMRSIAPPMALAVMAAEDQKFSRHWGFDITGIRDVLNHNACSRHIRGASTLSQQTAKNLLLWDGRSWLRKGLETGLTLGIEAVWTKRRILTVYLNIAEFGEGIFGVEASGAAVFS